MIYISFRNQYGIIYSYDMNSYENNILDLDFRFKYCTFQILYQSLTIYFAFVWKYTNTIYTILFKEKVGGEFLPLKIIIIY